MLAVPPSWILREARSARVPHVRLGRYVRFDPDALDAWWQARVQGPRWRAPGSDPRAAASRGTPGGTLVSEPQRIGEQLRAASIGALA
jgi:hypothetical protein